MPSATPTLSVTVLNYNYAHLLTACVESILSQTFKDFALVIIDDCSISDCGDLLNRFLHDSRVTIIRHPSNAGFRASLREGSSVHSTSKYLTVISADDYVSSPQSFQRQVDLLESDVTTSMCFTAFERVSQGSQVLDVSVPWNCSTIISGEHFLDLLMQPNGIPVLHSGTMIRRSAFASTGGYSQSLEHLLDTDLWSRLVEVGPVAYISEICYSYRVHRDQMSVSPSSFRAFVGETDAIVNRAFRTAARRGWTLSCPRSRVLGERLAGYAASDAFAGRPKQALARLSIAFRKHPVLVSRSRNTWIALARIALGEKAFGYIRSVSHGRRPQA